MTERWDGLAEPGASEPGASGAELAGAEDGDRSVPALADGADEPDGLDLSPAEVRVVGCLIEKQLTTPDVYPLTLNALLAACNQSSNRSPVVRYDEATAQDALSALRAKGLVRIVHSVSNRAAKYRHVLDERFRLEQPGLAVLAVLALRGAQTSGELRGRSERLHPFESVDEVEATLQALATPRWGEPLAARLERQPGQKEARWAHLLSGEPAPEAVASEEGASPAGRGVAVRLAALEAEVARLRADLDDLRGQLGLPPGTASPPPTE